MLHAIIFRVSSKSSWFGEGQHLNLQGQSFRIHEQRWFQTRHRASRQTQQVPAFQGIRTPMTRGSWLDAELYNCCFMMMLPTYSHSHRANHTFTLSFHLKETMSLKICSSLLLREIMTLNILLTGYYNFSSLALLFLTAFKGNGVI